MTATGPVSASVLQAEVVQDALTTRLGKITASLLIVGGFVAVAFVIRGLGPRLKDDFAADDVEAIQAVLVSLAAAATGWFLVVIWRAVDEVVASLAVARIGARQGVLALVGVLTLFIAYTLTRVSKGLIEGPDGDVITAHRREAIHHILQLVIYVVAAMFILSLAGVNPGNLLVGAGAIGLVVGLAARQTLGAILAGLVLLFARPLEVGDWVVVDDKEGIVSNLTLFNTELRTWDDEHVMIPNDQVAASSIVNRSRSGRLRISIEVGVDYDADVTRAAEIAEQAMRECEVDPLMQTPSPTVVGQGFGESAITLECRFWISDPSARRKWHTQTAIIRAIKDAYEEEGIEIPYPHHELVAREETARFSLADGATGDVPATGNGSRPEDGDQQ